MSVNTILLDLSVDQTILQSQNDKQLFLVTAETILSKHLPNLTRLIATDSGEWVLRFYQINENATVAIRIYRNGFVTINIEFYTPEDQEPIISFNKCKEIERELRIQVAASQRSQTVPPLKRCHFDRYFPTSDERLIEYDIDKVVFEEQSPFQKVQIVHSQTLGNMLVLDDLQNIAEADLIYTETLMQRGKENYEDKEVVILGGGDGALLYELLKENPREVIMLEIDEVVMKACAKYMRSICSSVLDDYNGPNYKIVVGDCMKMLDQYIEEGRKFDYVFGDLTDVPISEDSSSELWSFIGVILEKSFKVLKPGGKFMTHIIGSVMKDTIKQYQEALDKLQPPVEYTMSSAFVPSFLESWEFCQVSLKQ